MVFIRCHYKATKVPNALKEDQIFGTQAGPSLPGTGRAGAGRNRTGGLRRWPSEQHRASRHPGDGVPVDRSLTKQMSRTRDSQEGLPQRISTCSGCCCERRGPRRIPPGAQSSKFILGWNTVQRPCQAPTSP